MSLHDAVKQLAFEVCVSLIESGADVNAVDDDNKTPLHHAVGCDEPRNTAREEDCTRQQITELLLYKGANVDAKTDNGQTCLHSAAMCGSHGLVEILLEHGAAVDLACDLGSTALTLAIDRGYGKIVVALIQHGADVNAVCNDVTPLHRAVKSSEGLTDVTNILIRHGADVNKVANGKTALHLASMQGHVDLMEVLLKGGANVTVTDGAGETPLEILGDLENPGDNHGAFAALLEHGADPNLILTNRQPIVHRLVDKWISRKEKGFGPVVQLLIDAGACPNATDTGGLSLLHKCAGSHFSHDKEVQILILNGADIDAVSSAGETALHLATSKGYYRTVEILIENGADAFARNSLGETGFDVLWANKALFSFRACEWVYAYHRMKMRVAGVISNTSQFRVTDGSSARSESIAFKAKLDVSKMKAQRLYDTFSLHCFLTRKPTLIDSRFILEALQQIDIYDYPEYKWTLRSCIRKYARAVGATLEFPWNAALNGVPPLFRAVITNQDPSEFSRILRENGKESCLDVWNGKTAFHLLAEQAKADVMDILLKHGASVTAVDASGRTPLTVLIDGIKSRSVFNFMEKTSLQLLLAAGADANASDSRGETPLHVLAALNDLDYENVYDPSVYHGNADLLASMQMLLDSGATIDKRNDAGATALHLACASICERRILLLLDNGADISLENGRGRTGLDIVRSDPSCKAFFTFEDDDPVWLNRWKLDDNRQFGFGDNRGDQKAVILLEHTMKLMALGYLPKRVIKIRGGRAYSIFSPPLTLPDVSSLSLEMDREIHFMKNHKLCCHLTLFDMLFKENESSYLEFELLRQALDSVNLKAFRFYGAFLENILKRCRRKHIMIVSEKCLGVLIRTTNVLNYYQIPVLPPEMERLILAHLNLSDRAALISCVDRLRNQVMSS